MALKKQPVSISFNGGIDTKTDSKQILQPQPNPQGGGTVIPTKLLELENGVFTKRGQIRKRYGYDILEKTILTSGAEIDSAAGIANFKDELILFNGIKLYTYIDASEAWIEKGTSSSVTLSNRSVIKNIYQQTNPDYAYNNGIGCYVWKDSVGGCRYTVVDEVTGATIVDNISLSSSGISPRAVGIGQYIFIYYIETQTIKFKYIQLSTPQSISAATDLTTAVHATNKIYDVYKIGERVYISYNTSNGSNSIATFYQVSSKTVSAENELVGQQATGGISHATDASNNVWISWYDGTNVKYRILNYALDTTIKSTTTIETIANVRNIASTVDGTTGTFLYEVGTGTNNRTKKNTATLTGTVGSAANFVRGTGLASKFFEYNGEKYITLAFNSTFQSTYFVYSLGGDIITKINTLVGGGYTAASILPTVVEQSAGVFIIPTLRKGILETEDGVVFTSLGVNSSKIDFTSLNNFVTAQLGNGLHVVGGMLQTYDGYSVNETGFAIFPEGTTATETNLGAGAIPNGVYNYAVCYAWTDNQGQIHRSAPDFVSLTIASGNSKGTLTIPTLRITKKSNVFIEAYRTEVAGDVYYKITSNTSLTLNDTTADTISFVDNTTDATLVTGQILYTTGGVLDNIAPPSSSMIVTWKNRLVIKSSDDHNLLWYSKIREEGGPVEFNDSLLIQVDPQGGDITALGVMDSNLIIFKENSIHIFSGDGPNNLGQQSDFGLPTRVQADVGCVDVNSVVETPVGIMFKSKKGIYLLNRGLAVSYIGAEAEAFNSARITAAKLVPSVNQVRFTTEDDVCLVYDYFYEQWSTFTNHEAVGATNYDDKFTFAKSNGDVYVENSSSYADGAQAVKLRLVTSWMQFASIQGFQRIYKFLLLGEYKSKHRLNIKMGFNGNEAFTQEVTIDPFTVLNLTTYGEDTPYGSGTPYGGNFPEYKWRIYPKRQKCSSFRISIEDVMDDVFGESFNISNMRFEVGVKEGSDRLPSSKSYGTS